MNNSTINFQKQPFRGVLRKRCSENMQQIYRQIYWNRTSAWVFSCKFAAYFRNTFSKEHLRVAASELFKFTPAIETITAQKMIWSYLLKKSFMKNFIFCAVLFNTYERTSWEKLELELKPVATIYLPFSKQQSFKTPLDGLKEFILITFW